MKRLLLFLSLLLLVPGAWILWTTVVSLNGQITNRFEGQRWELPARIYGRPLELYTGKELQPDDLLQELELLRYGKTEQLNKPGDFRVVDNRFTIYSRDFHFPDGNQAATLIRLTIADRHITELVEQPSGQPLSLLRLEPLHIASIYPNGNEDRLFIPLEDTPQLLIDTLLLIEDRTFRQHHGIRPLAIMRALLANLKAGKTVQGGSTLTQQLVKNFFLSSEQTLQRKVNEALMALLLEYHYDKDEILESYLNEIYLGQDGKRAIHGFGMASRFYFGRNINELSPDQIALLVGIAKGASYYNPRKHPERTASRRNLIIETMAGEGLLSQDEAVHLQEKSLGLINEAPSGNTRYPAFVQLVRRQLKRDYREKDLQSEGLSIFTPFDPIIQHRAEKGLQRVLSDLERERKMTADTLQGAIVICSVDQGEVLAVVGDRFTRQAGFNRALDMKRPVGSVIKPAVYLTALSQPDRYNLLTTLYDTPIKIRVPGKDWQPQNYDKKFHGPIPLEQALVRSLNVATVQLGMDLGLDTVVQTLISLGAVEPEDIKPFPSLLLGAVELPPIDVLQMYQTIAAGGYKTPLRAILAVADLRHELLQRYPLTVEQAADPGAVFCLTSALQEVTVSGSGWSLQKLLPKELTVAGKTGTTDDLRDSWFAGFSGSHVAVAWIGRDDNKSTGLTGATGALRIWAAAIGSISTMPLQPQAPEDIVFYLADIRSGKIFNNACDRGKAVPFIRDGILPPVISCSAPRQHPRQVRPQHRQQETPPQENSFGRTLQQGVDQFLRIFQ
jgi:penicillin-binding protein 1B